MHNGLSICQTKYCNTKFLAMPSLLNIQSSSSGLYIVTSEVTKSSLVFQNFNKTYKNMSIYVVVTMIKYQ